MTEFMHETRLRQIAWVMEQPPMPAPRPTLVLRWSIDARTGRPVGGWSLAHPEPATA
jgi:hypothetical protein